MKSAALRHLETLLEARKLAGTLAFQGRGVEESVSTGVAALDGTLGGGWRRGELSELVGPQSSGRTSVLVATLSAATANGAVAALVDTMDQFDPEAAAARGLDLSRVLWVRGPALTIGLTKPALIDRAVHQAIRAFDLIVRAGGFAVVALDLADVPARYVRALPVATWLRIAHANEGRPSSCLLVGEGPMGRSARGQSVSLNRQPRWIGNSPQTRRFGGFGGLGDLEISGFQDFRTP
jgi:hypothetical protein